MPGAAASTLTRISRTLTPCASRRPASSAATTAGEGPSATPATRTKCAVGVARAMPTRLAILAWLATHARAMPAGRAMHVIHVLRTGFLRAIARNTVILQPRATATVSAMATAYVLVMKAGVAQTATRPLRLRRRAHKPAPLTCRLKFRSSGNPATAAAIARPARPEEAGCLAGQHHPASTALTRPFTFAAGGHAKTRTPARQPTSSPASANQAVGEGRTQPPRCLADAWPVCETTHAGSPGGRRSTGCGLRLYAVTLDLI